MTRPRRTATALHHPETQAGLVLEEDGTAVLRAGHALYDHSAGASLSLRTDGTVVAAAPAGLLVSGPVMSSSKPNEALCLGGYRFSPVWESAPVVTPISPALLSSFFVAPGANEPATVPLSLVLKLLPLYQVPEYQVPEVPSGL